MDVPLHVFGQVQIEGFPSFQYTSLLTQRLHLRPPREDEAMRWIEVRKKNISHLKPFEPQWIETWNTQEFYQDRVLYQKKEWAEDRSYCLHIIKREHQRLIGGININNVIRGSAQFASLGYWIDQAHEGQELMSESLDAVIAFCFTVLKLERINAAILTHNDRSRKLLERFHFEEEGLARRYAEINGKREGHILYGLNKGS